MHPLISLVDLVTGETSFPYCADVRTEFDGRRACLNAEGKPANLFERNPGKVNEEQQ